MNIFSSSFASLNNETLPLIVCHRLKQWKFLITHALSCELFPLDPRNAVWRTYRFLLSEVLVLYTLLSTKN